MWPLPIVVLLLALFANSVSAQSSVSRTRNSAIATGQSIAARVDSILRIQVQNGFRGVVLVAHGDTTIVRKGFGDDIRATTPFWIGSITKSFTAATILDLQARGKVSTTDSLSRFFPDAPQDKRSITVHQLLTHTAGLNGEYAGVGTQSRNALIEQILRLPLEYPPGKGYRYGNNDYQLLAAIIEQVSGGTWQDAVRRHVLGPLVLRHTGFWCEQTPGSAPQPGIGQTPNCRADWNHRGADGMWATADDLLTWIRALARGALPNRVSLAPIEFPQILVRREEPFDVFYGYGSRVYSSHASVVEVMHSGSSDDGNTSIARRLDDNLIIIVLANTGLHEGTTWSSYVASLIMPRVH